MLIEKVFDIYFPGILLHMLACQYKEQASSQETILALFDFIIVKL